MGSPSTADLLVAAEEASEPIEVLRQAGEVLRLAPEDHQARLLVARALAALGHRSDAARAFRVAAKRASERGFALAAIAALVDALELWPEDANLGAALGELHDAIHGLEPRGRAAVLPPLAPMPVDPEAEGSLLSMDSDDAVVARAAALSAAGGGRLGLAVEPSAVPLFSDLDREAFVELVRSVGHRRLAPGEVLVEQGQPGDALFLVVRGQLEVSRGEGEARQVLARLPAGAVLGEMALVTQQPRSATVSAVPVTEVLEVGVASVEDVARAHPTVRDDLVRFARRRILMNVVAASPVFRPFAPEARAAVLARFATRVAADGEVVLEQGAEAEGLFVVASGRVRVERTLDDGSERAIATLREGDVFGEIALLGRHPTIARVAAEGRAVLLFLERGAFDQLVGDEDGLREALSELAASRSAETEALMRLEPSTLEDSDLILL